MKNFSFLQKKYTHHDYCSQINRLVQLFQKKRGTARASSIQICMNIKRSAFLSLEPFFMNSLAKNIHNNNRNEFLSICPEILPITRRLFASIESNVFIQSKNFLDISGDCVSVYFRDCILSIWSGVRDRLWQIILCICNTNQLLLGLYDNNLANLKYPEVDREIWKVHCKE